jgi:hypothetical protein
MADGNDTAEDLSGVWQGLWSEGFKWYDGFRQEKLNNVMYHAANAALYALHCEEFQGDYPIPIPIVPMYPEEVLAFPVLLASYEAAWASAHWQRRNDRDTVKDEVYRREFAGHAPLVREVFGNPSRVLPAIPPCVSTWNSGTGLRLTDAAYDGRILPAGTFRPDRVAVLADALEEAGCQALEVLTHLREPGSHWRGCWVVDWLLDKK